MSGAGLGVVTLGADFEHCGVALGQSTGKELGGSVQDGWAGHGQAGRGMYPNRG